MSEEFIAECLKCSKLGVHSLESVRDKEQREWQHDRERQHGYVDCPHCGSVVELWLEKCNKCETGWSNWQEKPQKKEKDTFGFTMMMWLATVCPSCYPDAREDVIKHGEIRPRE